ncbi:MAG: hypothetical protein C0605_17720 [Hyphomicrobiales bacterium]|jgi:DMSO reductase family type II enzyme chaperone|nr:MAG: hypothetical protein C0605_17720 [Hyphomicrobiales bacterium]
MLATQRNYYSTSNLWGLLAFGFTYPEINQFSYISSGGFRRDITKCLLECLPGRYERLETLAAKLNYQDGTLAKFEAEYLTTCTLNQSIPLYECYYRHSREHPFILLELEALLNSLGVRVNQDSDIRVDSLTKELEIMHFLAAWEDSARLEGKNERPYLLTQLNFLNQHLSVWIHPLQRDINEKSTINFFRALSKFIDVFVVHETERLQKIFDTG